MEKVQADLKLCIEKQDELAKVMKQCIEDCENLATAYYEIKANTAQPLKVVEEERLQLQDDKIDMLSKQLNKVNSFFGVNGELMEVKSEIAVMSVSLDSVRSEMEELLAIKESAALASPPVQAICNELKQRERKQNNLVVFGLNEDNRDGEIIQELVTTVGTLSKVNSIFRIGEEKEGKPRPLVICFATKQGRDQLYSNLRNLKGRDKWNKVSVVPDLTKLQCVEEKKIYQQLLEEVTKKNEESEEGDGLWKVVGKRGTKRIVKHPREMALRPLHPGESLLQ